MFPALEADNIVWCCQKKLIIKSTNIELADCIVQMFDIIICKKGPALSNVRLIR